MYNYLVLFVSYFALHVLANVSNYVYIMVPNLLHILCLVLMPLAKKVGDAITKYTFVSRPHVQHCLAHGDFIRFAKAK